MGMQDIKFSDYFKLFVRREGKVVLGKHYSNLWLLCSVLFVTFLAIAFSNASLRYLEFKMNDPFINWVDIQNHNESDFTGFQQALSDDQLKQKFNYRGFQSDKNAYMTFCTSDKSTQNLDGRYFEEISTPLVQKILDAENVVNDCCVESSKLDNQSFGVIITEDALRNKLGYNDIPAYIYYYAYCDAMAAKEYGVELMAGKFAPVPLPVLAVVRQLPNSKDYIGTKFCLREIRERSMNLVNEEYHKSLVYFVPSTVNVKEFVSQLMSIATSCTSASCYVLTSAEEYRLPRLEGFAEGEHVVLAYDYEDEIKFMDNCRINTMILQQFADKGVIRVYEYMEHSNAKEITNDYISVHFEQLDRVVEFQQYVREKFGVDIDMSQINAKDNFNAVSIMANVLSWTMIIFAIVCIILFIVNLLQSYFQKVKRNLGTFKAFGISNMELISVYVLIMLATIIASIVVSLGVAWFVELFMWVVGLEKEGGFGYLSLWSGKTFVSVLIIIVASVYTVYVVMRNLLKDTPGDLIYDR